MLSKKLRLLSLSVLGTALLAGCADSDESILEIPATAPGAGLLDRYVSLGNSITAGTQAGGINALTQLQAYPALVARQAGVAFNAPLLALPGCPAPYIRPILISTERLGGAAAPPCALRQEAVAPSFISNVAYPGSFIAGAVDNSVVSNPEGADLYKTVLLGGRTQLQAMRDANPTFVSVWLGNNETLLPAALGNPALMVSPAQFTAALDSIARSIKAAGVKGAALIAPVNALNFAPRFQPGAYFWALGQQRALPVPVSNTCSPLAPGGRFFVSLDAVSAAAAARDSIRCTETAFGVTSISEYTQQYLPRLAAYKSAVKAVADQNGWIYIDPDVSFADDLRDATKFRKCQGLATATLATFRQALLATCPIPVPQNSANDPNVFGTYVSYDATHPSGIGHRAFANTLIREINAKYQKNIPVI